MLVNQKKKMKEHHGSSRFPHLPLTQQHQCVSEGYTPLFAIQIKNELALCKLCV